MEERNKIENIENNDLYGDYEVYEERQKRKEKFLAALLAALLMIITVLTGLHAKNEKKIYKVNGTKEEIIEFDEEDEELAIQTVTKIFAPGTHIFSKRYKYEENGDPRRQIEIPDGYEVFSIQDYIGSGYGDHTKVFDVFFVNNKTVEAARSKIITDNNDIPGYTKYLLAAFASKWSETGYFEPGIVIEEKLDDVEGFGLGLIVNQ